MCMVCIWCICCVVIIFGVVYISVYAYYTVYLLYKYNRFYIGYRVCTYNIHSITHIIYLVLHVFLFIII